MIRRLALVCVGVDLERAVRRALELKAFLTGVPYKRYKQRKR